MRKLYALLAVMICFITARSQTIPTAETGAPNNTAATAMTISNPAKVRGNLFPVGDIDYYKFTANAGDRVYAAVMTAFSSGSSTDCQLTLYAADGTTVIEFDDDNGSFAGLSSSIAGATIPSAGTYYLKVNDFTAGTASERGYDLYLKVQTGSPTAEVESNDTPATANSMPASGWVSGARSPAAATEQDWFAVTLAAGESVFISADWDPERDGVSYNGRLGFGLFGDATNQILVIDDAGTGDVSPNPNIPSEALFFTAKDAGTYYVFADAASAAVGGPTATYNISYTKFAATPGYVNAPSVDVPKAIGPAAGSVTSTITVPGTARIKDLSVRITLNHALMQDIDATLTAPDGSIVHLFTDIGAATTGGQAQMDMFLNDHNAIPVGSYTVVKGTGYQPELVSKLDQFKGVNSGGTWTLTLYDDAASNGGTLTAWSLDILPEPGPDLTGATTIFSTDFESGAAGFTHNGTADEWELGTPATAATSTTNPIAAFTTANSGVNCWKTDLDNTYNVSSNQNLVSPAIVLPATASPLWITWAMKYQVENASFDQFSVVVRPVGNPAAAVTLFQWLGATPTAAPGNPSVNVPLSSGWGKHFADISAFAGQTIEFVVNLTTDNTVNFGGVAIDDIAVYQLFLCAPTSITLGTSPSVCVASGTASLPYTATTGTPNQYSIDYNAAAEAAGFVDVVNAALPASPISLVIPGAATAGTYNASITVRNAGGCVSSPVAFTVTLNQVPNAVATPATQSICSGAAITTIALTGSVGGTVYNWTRNNTGTVTGIAANGSGNISGSLTNTTNAPVTVTFTITPVNNGCSGTPVNATVTVNPTPSINAGGLQVIITGSNGDWADEITWTLTNGSGTVVLSGGPYGLNPPATPSAIVASNNGPYSFFIEAQGTFNDNSCTWQVLCGGTVVASGCIRGTSSSSGCGSVGTLTVGGISACGSNIAAQTICSGSAIAPITLSGPVAGTTFNWTRNNTATVTGIAASGSGNITGTLTNTTNAPVVVTFTITPTANGCNGTPVNVNVTVNPTPTAVATPSSQTICSGAITPIALTGPVAGTTFAWTRNNTVNVTGIPASGSGNTISGTLTNTTLVAQTVTFTITPTANGCTGPTTTATVNLNAAPTITCPAPITAPSVVGTCSAPVTYSPTVTGAPAPTLTYSLSGATTGSGSGSGSGLQFNVGVTTVTITATNACGTVSCSFNITITDSQLPTITAQPVNRTVCAGSNAVFSVTAVTAPSAGGPIAYQWQQWNGTAWANVTGANTSSLTVSNTTLSMNTNTYRVVLTGLCTVVNSNPASLYVNPVPTVFITTNPANILPNQTATLTATANPAGGTFTWFYNGTPVPGVTGAVLGPISIDQLGSYRVSYTSPANCSATSADVEVSGLISDILWVYPNPNRGQFQVRFFNQSGEPASILVLNAAGQKVYERKVTTGNTNYSQILVDLGMKANGVYIVQLINGNGKIVGSKRIVVEVF